MNSRNDQPTVFSILKPENRDWARSLRIPALYDSLNSPVDYLYNLATNIFPEYDTSTQIPTNEENENAVKKAKLKHVRTIFKYYGIEEPDHWSPIVKLTLSHNKDEQESILSFNKAIENLQLYLNPDPEFRSKLVHDIEEKYKECESLAQELDSVAQEDKFYREKLLEIEKLIQNHQGSEVNKVRTIIDKLLHPVRQQYLTT